MNRPKIVGAVAAVAFTATLALTVPGAQADPVNAQSAVQVKRALDRYQDFTQAASGGWSVLFVNHGVSCFDMPGMGAMGEHYVGAHDLASVDAQTPQALIYEPHRDGTRQLVGIEYVVLKAAWDANHTKPPSLFGHAFALGKAPNMFGLPDNYSLHVWLWRNNPSGLFAPWNPAVHCP